MNHRLVSNAILMSLLVVTVSNLTILTSDNKNTNVMESFSFIKIAYAQNANTSSDDTSGLGLSQDNPMATVGLSDNSTNSTAPSTTNPTSSATVPEFGSVAPIILIVAISSMIIFRTKFSK